MWLIGSAFEIESCGCSWFLGKERALLSLGGLSEAAQPRQANLGGSISGREKEMNLANRKTLRMQNSLPDSGRLRNTPFSLGAVSQSSSEVQSQIFPEGEDSWSVVLSYESGRTQVSSSITQSNYRIKSWFWREGKISTYCNAIVSTSREMVFVLMWLISS